MDLDNTFVKIIMIIECKLACMMIIQLKKY